MLKTNCIILDNSTCCVVLISPELLRKRWAEHSNLQFSMNIIIWANESKNALTLALLKPRHCDINSTCKVQLIPIKKIVIKLGRSDSPGRLSCIAFFSWVNCICLLVHPSIHLPILHPNSYQALNIHSLYSFSQQLLRVYNVPGSKTRLRKVPICLSQEMLWNQMS